MRTNGLAARTNKDLVREVNALKAQLQKLSSALETDAGDSVSRAVSTIEGKSKQAIDSAIEAAQEFIDEYGESARETMDALAHKSAELRDKAKHSLVDNIENRPVGTLAAIVGIGFLAGDLCRRH
jgi:hypothetical protein